MLAASHSQVVTLGAPTAAPYAPSPSLLGTNDPLGRTSVRIPIVSFGFGGKLLTCFHGSSSLSTGFDVAMSSRASTSIHIRPLHGTIPQSALDTSAAVYPGPLFSDPGTPTTGLVRTGAATQTKTKKARVVKYLEERAEEISRGLGYLHQGSAEGLRAEAKRVLINLLKVMVENDGHLSGSSQIDSAVRAALLPELAASDKAEDNLTTPALGFAHIAESRPGYSDSSDTAVSIHTLRTSHLDKIQQLLLRGERRAAYQYAADEKLWAHAMVISSSIDKEAWKEVVNEFVRAEMASNSPSLGAASSAESHAIAANGREPLRVAYSLFAGHGSAAVQELLPPKPLTSLTHTLQVPTTTSAALTPMSPNFPKVIQMSPIPTEILSKWTETVAMMITSPLSMETSSALTTLGDQLAANKWVEAAHSCYLLSPQTSPVGGVGMPAVRVVLYGAPNSQTVPHFWKDPDPVIFSEIVEFALSLATPIKGQDAYAGIPTLQPYKLIRAAYLAEMGHVQLANRYCEAISSSLTRSSPYLNNTFIEQLKDLTDRLVAAPLVDKSGSWIGSKMTRPSLDKIGNWLEGRLTSFIAGEGDSPKPEDPHAREHSFSGPFAHYSTISSATSSTIPSPQMSTTNLTEIHSASLPARTGSAMALRPPSAQAQIARASSAMDYLRRKASPVPRMSSASAVNSSFTDLPPWGQNTNGYGIVPEATPKADRKSKLAEVQVEEEEGAPETPSGPQLGAWWGADSSAPTPTALSFGHGATLQAPTDGFISLMDDAPLSPAYGSQAKALSPSERSGSYQYDEDDDDDLGLGNNVNRLALKPEAPKEVAQKPAPEPPKSEPEAEKPAAASGGWLSRLWKRGDAAPPGPVKANLGEQSSFYYDKDLKRWVNKNVSQFGQDLPITSIHSFSSSSGWHRGSETRGSTTSTAALSNSVTRYVGSSFAYHSFTGATTACSSCNCKCKCRPKTTNAGPLESGPARGFVSSYYAGTIQSSSDIFDYVGRASWDGCPANPRSEIKTSC
ncbi:hypothetical protein EW026_g2634 [Hermanssonia centrifuga]|uniref:Protein transport protein sec16 n=1 Tax=Hermanssonia centrifuga TaxID=98765 RepID=A0A4S4KPJ7_9APHY|nr:hypothetical protein EW026_g2634 [Hermanssonia centrifuga]